MADTQEYLDSLYAKRAARAGVRRTRFADRETEYDAEWLDREIARLEGALEVKPRVRYASISKGFC
jgi:hypothetical protein